MLNVLFLSAGNKGEMFVGLMGKRSLVEGEPILHFLANVVKCCRLCCLWKCSPQSHHVATIPAQFCGFQNLKLCAFSLSAFQTWRRIGTLTLTKENGNEKSSLHPLSKPSLNYLILFSPELLINRTVSHNLTRTKGLNNLLQWYEVTLSWWKINDIILTSSCSVINNIQLYLNLCTCNPEVF